MSNTTTTLAPYCSGFEKARDHYFAAHGYVSVSVCVAGVLSNALALAVLARPELAAPTSSLLAALAATDELVMLEYIPFALHIYNHLANVFHTISIWLTVTLAVWRYLAVYHADLSRTWCTARGTKMAVLAAYLGSPLLCTPLFFAFSVSERPDKLTNNTIYAVGLSDLARANNDFLINANFWLYGVVLKLLPCALLSVLSQRLVAALLENKRRRRSLLNKADKDELPQGILGLLSIVLGESFFHSCYARLGELMDALALATSALNFPLYCVMSSQFRVAFMSLLSRIPCWPKRHRPLHNPDVITDDETKKTTHV
ncbi:hypothetical protein B566_EDAN005396 [Ephemera danica]|nr:hypothetical protein B566_EDAN005396 [Ephemera danica]